MSFHLFIFDFLHRYTTLSSGGSDHSSGVSPNFGEKDFRSRYGSQSSQQQQDPHHQQHHNNQNQQRGKYDKGYYYGQGDDQNSSFRNDSFRGREGSRAQAEPNPRAWDSGYQAETEAERIERVARIKYGRMFNMGGFGQRGSGSQQQNQQQNHHQQHHQQQDQHEHGGHRQHDRNQERSDFEEFLKREREARAAEQNGSATLRDFALFAAGVGFFGFCVSRLVSWTSRTVREKVGGTTFVDAWYNPITDRWEVPYENFYASSNLQGKIMQMPRDRVYDPRTNRPVSAT